MTEARAQFSELVNRVGYGKERIVLTRHGRPLVALVPAEALTDLATDDVAAPTVLDLSARASSQPSSDFTLAARETQEPQA